jgi:hypothetical protein
LSIEKYCSEIIEELNPSYDIEETLQESFKTVIKYLNQYPENLSLSSKKESLDVTTKDGITKLGVSYFQSFYSATIPQLPQTVSDEMVSIIMKKVFKYSDEEAEKIKISHKQSMASENAVGTLLERYLDSVLRPVGWAWCCGNFVKAIDFIKFDNGNWFELQIKNRSNSENSSSSAIRNNTNIHKWYRIDATTGNTKWNNLPESMQGLNLSEEGFKTFVEQYIAENLKSI